jgi:hypothetical protein
MVIERRDYMPRSMCAIHGAEGDLVVMRHLLVIAFGVQGWIVSQGPAGHCSNVRWPIIALAIAGSVGLRVSAGRRIVVLALAPVSGPFCVTGLCVAR